MLSKEREKKKRVRAKEIEKERDRQGETRNNLSPQVHFLLSERGRGFYPNHSMFSSFHYSMVLGGRPQLTSSMGLDRLISNEGGW